jgi:hypothetical protein
LLPRSLLRSRVPTARDRVLPSERGAIGLYEQLLKERVEVEERLGAPLPTKRGLVSKVLARRLEHSKERQGYAADLATMHRLIKKGPRNAGEGIRFGSLKAKYLKEHGELRAEEWGQGELL